MKKIYQNPVIEVIETVAHGILCETSAHGSVDKGSINKEGEEEMVKASSRNVNPVQWDDWQ